MSFTTDPGLQSGVRVPASPTSAGAAMGLATDGLWYGIRVSTDGQLVVTVDGGGGTEDDAATVPIGQNNLSQTRAYPYVRESAESAAFLDREPANWLATAVSPWGMGAGYEFGEDTDFAPLPANVSLSFGCTGNRFWPIPLRSLDGPGPMSAVNDSQVTLGQTLFWNYDDEHWRAPRVDVQGRQSARMFALDVGGDVVPVNSADGRVYVNALIAGTDEDDLETTILTETDGAVQSAGYGFDGGDVRRPIRVTNQGETRIAGQDGAGIDRSILTDANGAQIISGAPTFGAHRLIRYFDPLTSPFSALLLSGPATIRNVLVMCGNAAVRWLLFYDQLTLPGAAVVPKLGLLGAPYTNTNYPQPPGFAGAVFTTGIYCAPSTVYAATGGSSYLNAPPNVSSLAIVVDYD